MIIGMHIPQEFSWLPKDTGRIKTMCGVHSLGRLTGVPGMEGTAGAGMIGDSPYWCKPCCARFVKYYSDNMLKIKRAPAGVRESYSYALNVALAQLDAENQEVM